MGPRRGGLPRGPTPRVGVCFTHFADGVGGSVLEASGCEVGRHKLNEFDLLNEKKKKLSYRGGRHPIPSDDSAAASVPTPNPKKQPKPPRGGKGKDGKGKGDAGGAGSPDPAPQ